MIDLVLEIKNFRRKCIPKNAKRVKGLDISKDGKNLSAVSGFLDTEGNLYIEREFVLVTEDNANEISEKNPVS